MEPISPQAANLVSAVQALLVRPGAAIEGSTLMALLGQDVEVLYQTLTPGGVKLQLPSGQTVTAQGALPYPEGTQLRVRILPAATGETGLRLQLKEARPPAAPAILAPLLQSEAAMLTARLTQASPLPELAPLLQLLSVLADGPGALPTTEQLQAALRELPGTLLTSLGRALGAGGMASTQELSTSLQAFLADLQQGMRGASFENDFLDAAPQALVRQVILRFQTLMSQHPEIPSGDGDSLSTWLRNLLQKAGEETPATSKPSPALPSPQPDARSIRTIAADSLLSPKLQAALQSHTGAKAGLPESWESWIRGTLTTLSNPAISPREASFHALQAKEGTAFFEIPLPWAQVSPLQIWVESDAQGSQQGDPEAAKRVLLGLRFSNLGETRLGMSQGNSGLQIRIWTERPEALEREKENLEQELKGLGKTVDLRIYALAPRSDGTIPTVRSLVTGPSLRALG
jgi:hypothetical protein